MSNEVLESFMVSMKMEDKIAYLTLHNGKQNKLILPEFLELDKLKNWINDNKPIGIIICGSGRHFSAGADLGEISRHKSNEGFLREKLNNGKKILDYFEKLPIISVAAISGVCCGGGLEIALSCRFRIAANNSVFSFPESTIGLLPGMGGTRRLPLIIGKKNADIMIMSGDNYMALEALENGLIDMVVDKGEHITESRKFINDLCKNKSYNHIKAIINSLDACSDKFETEMFIQQARHKDF